MGVVPIVNENDTVSVSVSLAHLPEAVRPRHVVLPAVITSDKYEDGLVRR
jgi:hypothetical protein